MGTMFEHIAGFFRELAASPVLRGFVGYLVIVVVVGFITFRFTKTLADFLLAGRRLGAWVVAFSERASGESAWLLIGLPGLALATGFSAIWSAIGCAVGIFASWTLVARRLRVQTEKLGALTLPDYFEARFGDTSHLLRIVSMAVIVFFFTFYVSAQFLAAGKVLNTTFGLAPIHGMLIGAIIIIFYTIMGGFFAVAWTDLVQGILMAGAMILLPLAAWIEMGGVSGVAERIGEMDSNLLLATGGQTGRALVMGLVIGSLGIGLGYVGQPHLLTRFMAIRKPQDIRKGTMIAMSWVVVAFWGAVLVGIAGLAYFGVDGLEDPEHVMPQVATLFLPAGLAGIVISAAIAAMMSTADSQLLVATSALSEDIYHQLMNKEAPQRRLVAISRIGTVLIGVVAFVLALGAQERVYWFVLYAWSGLGAAFGPAMVLSLWWKRSTKWGVFAGMVVGSATTVIWHNVEVLRGFVYELVPAFALALAAVVVYSFLINPVTKRFSKKILLALVAVGGVAAPLMLSFSGAFALASDNAVGPVVGLALIALAFGGPALLILFVRMWQAIQDGHARTSAGKAVGLMFVPFFNLYWVFQVVWGFAKDYNAYVDRHSLSTPKLPERLYLALSILAVLGGLPGAGVVFMVVYAAVLVPIVAKTCDAVNALGPPATGGLSTGQTGAQGSNA